MARRYTIYGAYHISLRDEIERILVKVSELGIENPTILEASALIAEKNKRAKMNKTEVLGFFRKLRGCE